MGHQSAYVYANTTPLIAGSGNVANASAAATLTGISTTTVYIAGFEVTGSGATAGSACHRHGCRPSRRNAQLHL
jgi:hypothetical protein